MAKLFAVLIFLISQFSFSQIIIQNQKVVDKVPIDSKLKSETIFLLAKQIKENYVYPDVAEKLSELLQNNLKSGTYDKIDDAIQFSQAITADLQALSKDKHLHVNFIPELAAELKNRKHEEGEGARRKYEQDMESGNFGFRKAEILEGNIGYLDLRTFISVEIAKQTAVNAMGFFANADALIFDIRNNNGGDPDMVQFLCSYLFDAKPVHLNDIYNRPSNSTEEFWTLENIPGKRLPDIPVYILTSRFAFSGAEEFAYNLKNLKRAVLVGETTGGGANPNTNYRLNDYMVAFISTGKAINPITKTNWEGVGVKPDIECKAEDALDIAKMEILKTLLVKVSDEQKKQELQWQIDFLNASVNPVWISIEDLQKLTGDYSPRKISFEEGKLYYERPGVTKKVLLIPLSATLFMPQGKNDFRLQFSLDASGNPVSVIGIYKQGMREENKKIN
ncbi:MAG: S41 family peptidase [Ignavibacteria bacterium]|nr:S41 family peptidase [Ignavibacteria bacterium]